MSQDLFTSPKCCIFKTPTILREHNENACVPDDFLLGLSTMAIQSSKKRKKLKVFARPYFSITLSRGDVENFNQFSHGIGERGS